MVIISDALKASLNPNTQTYWIAYSGGLDSHVLLHACAALRNQFSFRAIHIHHGLSAFADDWAIHCETICRDLHIPFEVERIKLPKKNIEEAARRKRYEIFSERMGGSDVLLTAHHQNDQAETVLLQLLRGASPKGLAAMPKTKRLGDGLHERPFLGLQREDLAEYAKQHQLIWVEDESNLNIDLSRNFLRHKVIPLLSQHWPAVTTAIARSANHCSELQTIVSDQAKEDFEKVRGDQPHTLSIDQLQTLNPLRQKQVIRYWIETLSLPLPSAIKLQQIFTDVISAASDKLPCVIWENNSIRRYRNNLYILPMHEKSPIGDRYQWDLRQPLELTGLGVLKVNQKVLRDPVTVRFKKNGDKCYLPGKTHSQTLKNLFQEWGVPPWERSKVPLIFDNEKLLAAVGYFISEECINWDIELKCL